MPRAWRAGLLALALVTGAAAPAAAVRISGLATGGPPPVNAPGVDLYGRYRRNDRPAGLLAPNPLIVLLVPKEGPIPPLPEGQRAIMDQRHEQFTPRALAVRVGTTVDFVNSDEFYHNVFSLSTSRKFNLGRYRKGVARSVLFDKPGLVKLFCDIHPRMIGYILATNTPWFGSATPAGDFSIDDVPPGRYDLLVWHERLNEPLPLTTVDVGPGAEQRLDFAVPNVPAP